MKTENKDYLKWRTCMIGRGWGIPTPKPNTKGLLFSFGGTGGGSSAGYKPPPGQSLLSSPDLQACAAKAQARELVTTIRGVDDDAKPEDHRAGIAVVAVLVAGGLAFAVAGGGSSTAQGEVVVFSRVQTRTLQNTVPLNGTLARKQIRNITAATQGLVSAVNSTERLDVTQAGQAMFAINGRDAIAEDGTVPFFRSLAAGRPGRGRAAAEADPGCRRRLPGADRTTTSTSRPSSRWPSGRPSTTIRTRRRPTPSR